MTFFIAEICSNHLNNLSRSKKLIDEAKRIGCDAVKFQLFKADKLFAPAILKKSVSYAFIYGALYGFFTYMTYELTNLAVLKDWPIGIVAIDILWGTVLSSLVAGISTWIYLSWFGSNI